MKAILIAKPGAALVPANRPVPEPGAGAVRVKVAARGVCHSDALVKEGHWPGVSYPRVPGHEVAGTIDAVGPGVNGWSAGDRVGIASPGMATTAEYAKRAAAAIS